MVVRHERYLRTVLGFQRNESQLQQRAQSGFRFSVALPLGINGDEQCLLLPVSILIWVESLRFEESRGPDVSPREARNTPLCVESCVPPGRPTHLKAQHPFTAQKYRIRSQPNICSPPAVSATSSVELQPAAWGGGGLRDPKGSQKLGQQFAPILSGSSSARPPTRQCLRALRLGSLYPNIQLAASGEQQRAPTSCSPPRGVAANCAAQRAAEARPKARPNSPPKSQPHARPSAARKPTTVFESKEQSQPKAQPSSPPRVRFTAAPLSLRRFFARRGNLVKTRQQVLTISLFRRGARSKHCPGWYCSFWLRVAFGFLVLPRHSP